MNKTLILAIASIFLLVATVGASVFIFSRVSQVRANISELEDEKVALEDRLNLLRENQASLEQISDQTLFVLPPGPPVLPAVSQLRSIAVENQITLSELKVSPIAAEGALSSIEIRFIAQGEALNTLSFVKALSTAAPIMNLSKIEMAGSQISSTTLSEVSVLVYHAPLPDRLSALSEPKLELSSSEQSLLEEVSGFLRPTIGPLPEPIQITPRENPFQ